MKSSALLLTLAALVLLLLQGCSANTELFKDASGQVDPQGIAQLEAVDIGHHRQWLLIRGANKDNPVLLFLHGGPGSPYVGLAHTFQAELEKHFVVVQWDQRGSGKSFTDTPPGSMTVDQFHADTHDMVLWLRQRFHRQKIYLLGHSWGAYLGIVEARNHPENLYAYIGAGQLIDLVKQEQLSHDFVTERATAVHDERALQQLREIGAPPYRDAAKGMDTKYGLMWEYGGMLEGATGPTPFVKALLTAKEYSMLDVVRFVRGSSYSLQQLAQNEGDRFWRLKAPDPAAGFQVPVFFITGAQDRVTPAALVEAYEGALSAPMKRSIIIPNAGHFAFFTQSQAFTQAVVDIRARTYTPLPNPLDR